MVFLGIVSNAVVIRVQSVCAHISMVGVTMFIRIVARPVGLLMEKCGNA